MANPLLKRSIKNCSEDDKPREKLSLQGRNALSNSELLAILLRSGSKQQSAVDLAQNILTSVDNNLNRLGRLSISDLQKFKGIGAAKAITIAAALELGRRRKKSAVEQSVRIRNSKQAYEIIAASLMDLSHEEFWIVLLNRSNTVLKHILLSKGGVNQTVVDKKLICKYAIDHLASAIILYHNHPSGNINPSKADINLTSHIEKALALIDVQLFDHIVVGNNTYFSFADGGLL